MEINIVEIGKKERNVETVYIYVKME